MVEGTTVNGYVMERGGDGRDGVHGGERGEKVKPICPCTVHRDRTGVMKVVKNRWI